MEMLTDKINGDADRHASVHLAEQYDLIVSLYSPMYYFFFLVANAWLYASLGQR